MIEKKQLLTNDKVLDRLKWGEVKTKYSNSTKRSILSALQKGLDTMLMKDDQNEWKSNYGRKRSNQIPIWLLIYIQSTHWIGLICRTILLSPIGFKM
jgi:hypothetical protein